MITPLVILLDLGLIAEAGQGPEEDDHEVGLEAGAGVGVGAKVQGVEVEVLVEVNLVVLAKNVKRDQSQGPNLLMTMKKKIKTVVV